MKPGRETPERMRPRGKFRPPGGWLRGAGLAIAFGWAIFWTWFGLASGIHEKLPPLGVILHAAVPGGCFAASAALLFFWERTASFILIGSGVLAAAAYAILAASRFPPDAVPSLLAFMIATIALPPVAAGVLVLLSRRISQTPPRDSAGMGCSGKGVQP